MSVSFRFNVPMLQHVPLFIGLRYIRAKRRNQFISFVSGFSLLGMMLGVAALVLVMSVMNGLDKQIKEDILKAVAHGFLDQEGGLENWSVIAEKIEQHPQVVATSPYIEDFALLSNRYGVRAIQVEGILPHREKQVSQIADNMDIGRLDDLKPGEYGIVLGSSVADYFGVSPGDEITLTTSQLRFSLLGAKLLEKKFTVVGRFDVAQMNQQVAFIHVADAQQLLRYGDKVQGLRIKTSDMYQAPQIMQALAQQFDDSYRFLDWTQTQKNLFQAIKMEKILVFLMLLIIIAIAALNIVSSLVLMVADKRSDIAVLRTLGMTGRQIMSVFMIQGMAVGFIGLIIGLIIGGIGAVYISDIIRFMENLFGAQMYDPTVFVFAAIPSEWHLSDSLIVTVIAILLSLLATLYPAFRASKIEPAEALRYE